MKIAAVIPARFGSSRFPGKPLVPIAGISMIERVYRQVLKSRCFTEIVIATDDDRIKVAVNAFGGNARMTSSEHSSGTDRIWEAIGADSFDAVVNIQGDEPLISPHLIRMVADKLRDSDCSVVTAAFENHSYSEFLSPHIVKVVLGASSKALYFSRSPIPAMKENRFNGFFQHVGIYGYSFGALKDFVHWKQGRLEKSEKLEQLRFLENGMEIKVVKSDEPSLGVDVPEDIALIEARLERRI